MRRAARIDANQAEIVKALRGIGCSVQILATVGDGCPDLLVGDRGQNFLMEAKDGNKPPSARSLTDDQKMWHGTWKGQAWIVHSAGEAVRLVQIYREEIEALERRLNEKCGEEVDL